MGWPSLAFGTTGVTGFGQRLTPAKLVSVEKLQLTSPASGLPARSAIAPAPPWAVAV